jgi:site-specific recombinase XerD
MSNRQQYIPKPVFDTIEELISQYKDIRDAENSQQIVRQWLNDCFINSNIDIPKYTVKDYQLALNFLYSYRGSHGTFVAYRRDLERFLQWSWFIRGQSVLKHKREDIETFVEFCLKPYKRWIGLKKVARFKNKNGKKSPNPEWRPFEVHVSKQDRRNGKEPNKNDYKFSQQSLRVLFGILSSFYNYLLQEEIAQINPVLLIRQKSKFIRKEATAPVIRRLSNKQWQTVINLVKKQAKKDTKHERTVFILSCLYGMYLRISELVSSPRWSPTMGDFFKDNNGNWWFKTVGKGNKARQIAVSASMLKALKHYRTNYMNLPPYPTPSEKTLLIPSAKNENKPIMSARPISVLVQRCFDNAADELEAKGDHHEADLLRTATVHWLRHTGISEDVKVRPREHVRDDAGHSSGAITDRYIDVELQARAKSARKKIIDQEEK